MCRLCNEHYTKCANYVMNIKSNAQMMLRILRKCADYVMKIKQNVQIMLWILNKMCRLSYEYETKWADYVMNYELNAQNICWIKRVVNWVEWTGNQGE